MVPKSSVKGKREVGCIDEVVYVVMLVGGVHEECGKGIEGWI